MDLDADLEEYLDTKIIGLTHLCDPKGELVETSDLMDLIEKREFLKTKKNKPLFVLSSPLLTKAAVVLANTEFLERYVLFRVLRQPQSPSGSLESPTVTEGQNAINEAMKSATEVFKEIKPLTTEEFRAIYIAILTYTQDVEAIKRHVGERVYHEYFRQMGYYLQKYKKEIPSATTQFQKNLSL